MQKDRYYMIKSKNLAVTISYLLNEDFYVYDDLKSYGKDEKIYTFKDTKKFREILKLVQFTKNQNKTYNK